MAGIVYYLLVLPLSYLPLWVLYRFSDLFFLLLITVFPYRKKVIEDNLRRSFPERSTAELKQLKSQFYRHFADILIEGVKNLTISREQLQKRLIVKNPEVMDSLYQKGKSVILVSGHYNNWEWIITSQSNLFRHRAMGIGMPLSSKFWDKKVNTRRERYGMKVIHSGNFREEISKAMEQPIAILTLSDQSPGDSRKSYWMEFLNQPTAVLFGCEQMANEYDMAVVFFITRKKKRGFYEMELKLLSDQPRTLEWGSITEQHTRLLEKEILAHPPFWMWSHKRWKRTVPEDLEELKKEQHAKFDRRFRDK